MLAETKKTVWIAVYILILSGCLSRPENFTIPYINEDTGLNRLININGYYICQFGCDTSFFSIFTFYEKGLFRIATTSTVSPELITCFTQDVHPGYCRYPHWGTYSLTGDTIKTQTIKPDGTGCVIFRDYLITGKEIINISDYVEPQHTDLGYMINYPSFRINPCPEKAQFFPLDSKLNGINCPFYKKKWFNAAK